MKNWGNFEGTTLFNTKYINVKSISKEFANKVINNRAVINKNNKEQILNKEEQDFINDWEKYEEQSLKNMEASSIAYLN